MAVVLSEKGQTNVPGSAKLLEGGDDQKLVIKQFQVTGDTSYPTGGSPLTAADLGLSSVLFVDGGVQGGFLWEYDIAAGKLKSYSDTVAAGAMAETPNATNMSATVVRFLVIGLA